MLDLFNEYKYKDSLSAFKFLNFIWQFNYLENAYKLLTITFKIKATKNMETMAHELGLSRAGAYKFLEEMKEEGFSIACSKRDNLFYYTIVTQTK